jgi:hypothetical protein
VTPQSPLVLMIVFSAVTAAIFARPGLWGFGGALVYGLGQLSAALFGESASDARVVRKAWLQFVTSLFFGAIAAEGFGPTIADLTHNAVRPQAVWLVVGLSANGMWPVIERLLGARLGAIVKAFLGERP